MAKCTVLPPTERPLLLAPSTSGSLPSQIRSPVQYSFCWCVSSEAKSSSGRHHGPASKPTTENPASARRQASVAPPAPVPTMAKSTGSPSRYSRIGSQPPTRSTSGARPCMPRGTSCASSGMRLVLDRLPGISPVELHADIAARAGGASEADLAPGRRMAVVGSDDVEQQPLREDQPAPHPAPGRMREASALRRFEQCVLLRRIDRVKRYAEALSCFRVERGQAAPPRLAQRRQARIAITIASVLLELVVDHRRDGHGRTVRRLRHDARRHRLKRLPFGSVEEARLARQGEPLVDDAPRLLVPGRRVALSKHVVTRIARAAHAPVSMRRSAASPAIASAVNAGGAGRGGPFRRFCERLRQPPMLRWTP